MTIHGPSGCLLNTTYGLRLLYQMTGSHRATWALACKYRSWDELVGASRMDLAAVIGLEGLRLRIPVEPPELAPLPIGVWTLYRTDSHYPAGIIDCLGTSAPVVLYGWGSTAAADPAGTVAIGGALYADEAGIASAQALVHRLTRQHRRITAAADYSGVGHSALEAAAAAGAPAVAWLGGGIAPGSQAGLLVRVVDAGGCVLTACPPSAGVSGAGLAGATRLAVCSSTAAMLVEAGPARELGDAFVGSALAHDRPLSIAFGDDIVSPAPAGLLRRALVHPHRSASAAAAAGLDLGPVTAARIAAGGAAATVISA